MKASGLSPVEGAVRIERVGFAISSAWRIAASMRISVDGKALIESPQPNPLLRLFELQHSKLVATSRVWGKLCGMPGSVRD